MTNIAELSQPLNPKENPVDIRGNQKQVKDDKESVIDVQTPVNSLKSFCSKNDTILFILLFIIFFISFFWMIGTFTCIFIIKDKLSLIHQELVLIRDNK